MRSRRLRRTKWTDPDGGLWKQHVMSERAYCLHIRDGIFGVFAYAWEDSAVEMRDIAPSDIARVDAHPGKWALPRTIKAGSFCRLLYIQSERMGTYRVEPISEHA